MWALLSKPLPKYNNRRGFTIVELLVVIVIIGILATIVTIAYNGIQQRARIATLQSDMSSAITTLGIANVNAGTYPADLPTAGLKSNPGTSYQYTYSSTNNGYCLIGTNSNVSYVASSINPIPVAGSICPNSGVVTTLAGSTQGFADGTGTGAQFNQPYGVTVDSSGTVYVADWHNHRIRKITSGGVVTTLAGSTQGSANGTGIGAQFSYPAGVAVDSSGNVYVADAGNHRIRKITTGGSVTTLAGSTQGFADGTGTGAQFSWPYGITVDSSGNVYVGDSNNHRIRKITSGGVVTTLAGSGTAGFADGTGTGAQFNGPYGVAVDSSGTVYVADQANQRIRKVTSGGVVTTLAGSTQGFADGTGTGARFNNPVSVVLDNSGIVYVTDQGNNLIRRIAAGGVVTTLAGSVQGSADGTSSGAQFNWPSGITIDSSGNLYVADWHNDRIRKIQ